MNCLLFLLVPSFEFDPITYSESENPSRTAFAVIMESDGQTFAPGVSRSVIVNSQPISASMSETI